MTPNLSYGGSYSTDYTRPGQSLGYGSMTAWGTSPSPAPTTGSSYAMGSVGRQVGANQFMPSYTPTSYASPPVAAPAVAVPAVDTPAAATPALSTGKPTVVGNDSLANSLRGIIDGDRGWFGNTFRTDDGGLNLDNIGSAIQSVGALGSLWGAFQQNRLARDMFDYQKKTYETNARNQTQSYNTALEDRIRARYAQEGRSGAAADSYIEKNRLKG